MITDALIVMFGGLVSGLFALLPPWSIDIASLSGAGAGNIIDNQGVTATSGLSGFETILVWAQRYNNFIPFDQLTLIISFAATFYAAMLVYRLVKWIIGILRGAGTS